MAILHPVDGHTYVANQTLRLWGSVTGLDGEVIASERGVWLMGEREIGRGLDTWTTLEAGEHKLALQVESESGNVEASVAVMITDLRETEKAAN